MGPGTSNRKSWYIFWISFIYRLATSEFTEGDTRGVFILFLEQAVVCCSEWGREFRMKEIEVTIIVTVGHQTRRIVLYVLKSVGNSVVPSNVNSLHILGL